MNALATALYVLVGIVNLLPASGALSTHRLQSFYGISLVDPNLIILMRHRAVLFGVIGALLIAAAFHRPFRTIAMFAGLLSMSSFVLIAYTVGAFNAELGRVVFVDLVASLLLIGAGLTAAWSNSRGARKDA